ncbi:MAG: hypothetical protein U5J83_13610 [Bryobacterales bacterium]|nr:hypothetical protein [Bryobacterales bacterium]
MPKSIGQGNRFQVDVPGAACSRTSRAADVNLAVVDEAYFALYPQEVDSLGAPYEPALRFGILYDPLNMTDAAMQGGAEGAEGGEGDDSGTPVRKSGTRPGSIKPMRPVRSDLFQIAGQPDNLPVDGTGGHRGSGGWPCDQPSRSFPLFVQLVLPIVFLEGDAPTLLLRAYGEGMTQPDTDYEVTLATGAGEQRQLQRSG